MHFLENAPCLHYIWLYYAIWVYYGGFRTIFFLLSVSAHLKERKKEMAIFFKHLILVYTIESDCYPACAHAHAQLGVKQSVCLSSVSIKMANLNI